MEIKPLHKNPIKLMLLGVLLIIGAVLLEAYLPRTDKEVIRSEYIQITTTGALTLCGVILFIWPILKQAWSIWRERKNSEKTLHEKNRDL